MRGRLLAALPACSPRGRRHRAEQGGANKGRRGDVTMSIYFPGTHEGLAGGSSLLTQVSKL